MPPVHYLRLHELAERLHNAIAAQFNAPLWVVAEVASIREAPSGHCYLELTEVDPEKHTEITSMRAMIWASTYSTLRPFFEDMTQTTLRKGLQLLMRVRVEYSVRYGMALQVIDIDPQYTVGELAIQRQKTLAQLEEDGIIDMNHELPFPEFPRRIAIISAAQAAGYEDFCHQLGGTIARYHIHIKLFPALMQGDKASLSIREALYQIADQAAQWDIVVIIRGGGGKMDLSCFDDYELAAIVAQFPLPIVTGIGHERDVSVVDHVAHTSLKTPTAVAAALESIFVDGEGVLREAVQNLLPLLKEYTASYTQTLERICEEASLHATHLLSQNIQALRLQAAGAALSIQGRLREYTPTLQHLVEKNTLLVTHCLEGFPPQLQQTVQGLQPCVSGVLEKMRMEYLCTLAECMARDPRQALRNGYALLRPVTLAQKGEHLQLLTQEASYEVEVQSVKRGGLFSDDVPTTKSIRERLEEELG